MNGAAKQIMNLAPVDPAAMGKVAVLYGGTSAEREISLMSGQGVLDALRSRGVNAQGFDTGKRSLQELEKEAFARCFIVLHGRGGEDGTVQGALELLGLPYTGPGVAASAIAVDKVLTKRLWRQDGLSTPAWRQASSPVEVKIALETLGAPMIVKPDREGSTIGLSKISTGDDCAGAFALAAKYDERVLCEEFISGQECTCALLEVGGRLRALPLVRVVAPQGNYDYYNKYFGEDTRYYCPSGFPAALESAIQDMCLDAFRSLGARGWGRADVMIRESDGRPFLLELNTAPGMTGHSLVPMAAAAAGIDYPELCLQILASARCDAGLAGRRPDAAGGEWKA